MDFSLPAEVEEFRAWSRTMADAGWAAIARLSAVRAMA